MSRQRSVRKSKSARAARRVGLWLVRIGLLVGCERNPLIGIQRFSEDQDAAGALEGDADTDGAASTTDGAASADESGSDAGSPADAADPNAEGEVALTVLKGGAPLLGARVLLHDGSGELLGEERTDRDGQVAARGAGMLTLAAPPPSGSRAALHLISYVGLEPGDELVLALPADAEELVGTYQVSWEGSGPFLTLQIGGCDGAPWSIDMPAQQGRVPMTQRCVDRAKSALGTYESESDMGRSVHGFLSAKPLPVLQAGTASVQLTQAHEARFIELTSSPPGAIFTSALGASGAESFRLPVHTAPWTSSQPKVGFPADFLDTLLLRVGLAADAMDTSSSVYRELAREVAPNAGTYQADFQAALPVLDAVRLQTVAGQRAELRWESTASLTRADQGLATFEWVSGARWLLVFPGDAQQLTLPLLPADLTAQGAPKLRGLCFTDYESLPSSSVAKAHPQRIGKELWSETAGCGVVQPDLGEFEEWTRTSWLEQASAACNILPVPDQEVPVQYAAISPPAPIGGVVQDGVYRLEQMVVYAAEPQTTIERRSESLEVTSSSWQHSAYYGNTPIMRYSQSVTLDGASYRLTQTCGTAEAAQLLAALPQDRGEYSATPELLSLWIPVADAPGARAVFTYRLLYTGHPSCLYNCEAGISYTVVPLATGSFRYTINRVDTARDRCTRLVLVAADRSAPGFSVTTPPGLGVEGAWVSPRAADCQTQGGAAPADVIRATGASGSLHSLPRMEGCWLEGEIDLSFESGLTDLPREQRLAINQLALDCPPAQR